MRKSTLFAAFKASWMKSTRIFLLASIFFWMTYGIAQAQGDTTLPPAKVSAWRIFVMLFLLLGPIKILLPFVTITRDLDGQFRQRLARRAIIYSFAALAVAGLLGKSM